MFLDYKAKSPLEAFKKTVDSILINWDKSHLAIHLPKAVLKDYHDGQFTFEVPTEPIAILMRRHAELTCLRRTLEDYMPDGIAVSVQIVSKDAAHLVVQR